MTTDQFPGTGQPSRRPDDLKACLVAEVHSHSRDVIKAELNRLSRRVPTLGRTDLDVIHDVLEQLSESLILAGLRNASPTTVPLLSSLLGKPSTQP